MVDGQELPLESDPTAALAYQLEGNPLYAAELFGLLRGGLFRGQLPRDRAQDGLFLMHPYRPGKIPLVLVHGTASSPLRWAELINELQGDPEIDARYQIWLFTYDSGNPIPYSAGRLRQALTDTLKELDPKSQDPALRRMVVLGHSQGGLLTKLTAIDSGDRIWKLVSDKPFETMQLTPESRDLLRQSLFFKPLPFVERVIFLATPQHGALMASGRIGAIGAWLVSLPVGVLTRFAQAATLSGDEKLMTKLRRPPTAIDNMNPENPGLQVLASIPVTPRIPAHSIIAVEGNGPKEEGDDGVVAYRSAHIPEAVSEKVVRSGHSCQGQPETIEEVRRILNLHAATPAPAARP
jgi:pimeloyl-ACP methyl ester carboxylesterase